MARRKTTKKSRFSPKTRFILRWTFIFIVLIIFTILALTGSFAKFRLLNPGVNL